MIPTPQKRPQPDCCSICHLPWATHPRESTIEDCVLLLRRTLEHANATIRHFERTAR
jgi:hypothetical protein